ncbi:MAG: hypothetical protein LBR88_06110 [Zoogloeaceae bacterium]|jgi:hypothetical protein|nr:hypothetical protein [Zoogloeaceae bacterium]
MKNETFISAFDVFENGRNAADPAKLRALRDVLFALTKQIRQKIDRGLPATEIAAARSLLTAAQTAENVVESLSA